MQFCQPFCFFVKDTEESAQVEAWKLSQAIPMEYSKSWDYRLQTMTHKNKSKDTSWGSINDFNFQLNQELIKVNTNAYGITLTHCLTP